MKSRIIELRCHTEARTDRRTRQRERAPVPRRAASALVIDLESTIDELQAHTFGSYAYCRLQAGRYVAIENGLFYADGLDAAAVEVLRQYGIRHRVRVESRSAFLKRVFWKAIRAEAFIVGFNLPYDLSRLAVEGVWSTRRGGAWSFTLEQYLDSESQAMRENGFAPRVVITPKDGKGAFFRLARSWTNYPPIRCLDLKTLIWALESRSHSLKSACKSRQVEGKLEDHEPTGRVTVEEINYNRQDVRATVNLLNALLADFFQHPIELDPDRAYSPASIAKAYLVAMGVRPPMQQHRLSAKYSGIAMQAYYGGRAECRIRHTVVPVVHTDFLSQYPTVHTLMGLQALLMAETIRTVEATAEVRDLLATFKAAHGFNPETWKRLAFFALVEPSSDVLPVRTAYNDATSNIGVNPLTSRKPIWYAGPDLLAAVLLTGKAPRIVRAFRLVPVGQQDTLQPVRLRGRITVDPRRESFFRRVIEARAEVAADKKLPKLERDALRYFLKILANSGAYGLFVELNPERVPNDPQTGKPRRTPIRVWKGHQSFPTTTDVIERRGAWFCPWLGSLTTAGGRLLLALLEREVTDAGGSYLLCDTDSMAIVASREGGLVPCRGGAHRMPDGREAVKALSWNDVRTIVAQFSQLNPYDRRTVPSSILKIEDVNFDGDRQQRTLYGYAIAAKRYALFTKDSGDGLQIVKASGHGLGYLRPPKPGFDEALEQPVWVIEAWDWIVRGVLGLHQPLPLWSDSPAMMRIAITTPHVLKALQQRQHRQPYQARVKPFNFVVSAILKQIDGHPVGKERGTFTLIAPSPPDSRADEDFRWVNLYDGKPYRLARPGTRRPSEAEARTYGDIVSHYRKHREAKSLDPEGSECHEDSAGMLRRTPVSAASEFRSIGKETDRRWEREDDISLLAPRLLVYSPLESARLIQDPTLVHRARQYSIRVLAKASGLSEKAIKAVRRGERVRKSTARKLDAALRALERDGAPTRERQD